MADEANRMGRPPKDAADRASARIMVRLRPATMEALETAAFVLDFKPATLAASIVDQWIADRG